MKANPASRALLVLAVMALPALAAGCSSNWAVPSPTQTPTPLPPAPPPPLSPPPSPPSPPRPTTLDWRAAPITPGDWTWGLERGQSVARFAGGALVLRCDRANGAIVLSRAGMVASPEPMTVTTTSGAHTLLATPQPGPALAVTLRTSDPLIDAMVFSRGRFVVEAPGLPALYVPSWPEVGRVAEDCR